jgi:hypothetical protein
VFDIALPVHLLVAEGQLVPAYAAGFAPFVPTSTPEAERPTLPAETAWTDHPRLSGSSRPAVVRGIPALM